jgi:hypothetical protein
VPCDINPTKNVEVSSMNRVPISFEICSWVRECVETQSSDWANVQAFIDTKIEALSPQDRAALEQQVTLTLEGVQQPMKTQ